MADSTTEADWVEKIGKPAYESIAEMVACLQADRERLEDLRDERLTHDRGVTGWDEENPEDAEELAGLIEAVTLDGAEQDEEQARTRIEEDALSVSVFGERVDGKWQANSFEILLATGGPAVRIMGKLDEHGEPDRAWLEVQDWFKPWTEYTPADSDILLAYCRCFYFGE